MKAEAFNFDVGVKNYKKNRLIVDKIHLTNEIRYTIETTNKPDFTFSIISHVNNNDYPLSVDNILRGLEIANLKDSFHFFINRKGNVITDVEMKDDTLLGSNAKDKINVVVCLDAVKQNLNNNGERSLLYSIPQLKTLKQIVDTFYFETRNTEFIELNVPNEIKVLSNCGFSINQYITELELI